MAIRVETLRGPAVQRHLAGLARLRIEVFREWPYLYDGSLNYESDYLRAFANAPNAAIVGAFDGAALIGASTAAPLAEQSSFILAPFRARGLPVEEYFYFGESVLKRAYRNQGLGVQFFAAREAAARETPGVKVSTFCAVIRDSRDPRAPQDYMPLDAFWRRRGYCLWDGMTCEIGWTELGRTEETQQKMQFWRKDLA
jgi:GNAT superfamily N-acetyltransferase